MPQVLKIFGMCRFEADSRQPSRFLKQFSQILCFEGQVSEIGRNALLAKPVRELFVEWFYVRARRGFLMDIKFGQCESLFLLHPMETNSAPESSLIGGSGSLASVHILVEPVEPP